MGPPVRLKGVCSAIGKVDNKGRVAIQIYEYGNVAIGTWDKNGYGQ